MGELRMSSREGIGRLHELSTRKVRPIKGVPVLTADLSRSPGLRTDLSAEGIHFINNQFLHALDAILLFETKIEFLRSSSQDIYSL
jgi:hypothetical protein